MKHIKQLLSILLMSTFSVFCLSEENEQALEKILKEEAEMARNIIVKPSGDFRKFIGLRSGFDLHDFLVKSGIIEYFFRIDETIKRECSSKACFIKWPFIKAKSVKFSFLRMTKFPEQEFVDKPINNFNY